MVDLLIEDCGECGDVPMEHRVYSVVDSRGGGVTRHLSREGMFARFALPSELVALIRAHGPVVIDVDHETDAHLVMNVGRVVHLH